MSESTVIDIKGGRVVRLPEKACVGVILSNQNIDENGAFELDNTNDNYATTDNVIFYGYSEICPHILKPSETTIILPCTNASQIFVKGRQGTDRRVYYSLLSVK